MAQRIIRVHLSNICNSANVRSASSILRSRHYTSPTSERQQTVRIRKGISLSWLSRCVLGYLICFGRRWLLTLLHRSVDTLQFWPLQGRNKLKARSLTRWITLSKLTPFHNRLAHIVLPSGPTPSATTAKTVGVSWPYGTAYGPVPAGRDRHRQYKANLPLLTAKTCLYKWDILYHVLTVMQG